MTIIPRAPHLRFRALGVPRYAHLAHLCYKPFRTRCLVSEQLKRVKKIFQKILTQGFDNTSRGG